jgi:NAD(P)-dependent dehydrogenase (short-subunit alcohol dehydrogenase family)
MRMSNKVALVTGAAGGIGSATARVLAREGAKVVIADLDDIRGSAVAADIIDAGGRAIYVRLDVTDRTSWDDVVASTLDAFGGLSTLVNVAGIWNLAGFETETEAGWDKVIAVNQTSIFHGTRACLSELIRNGSASIVNISSLLALRGSSMGISYHASKAAVWCMTKASAAELGKYHIRANTVFPGFVPTQINANRGKLFDEASLRWLRSCH